MRKTILRTVLILAAVLVPLGAWMRHALDATRAPHIPTPKLTIGAYASPSTVADAISWRGFLARTDTTALNAVVLELMSPAGVHFRGDSRLARKIAAPAALRYDLEDRVAEAHAHHLFVIGLVDVSRNPRLARERPKWTLRTRGGHPWRDRSGRTSLDVSNDDVCGFVADIARQAARAGVDEIMLDELRLPSAGGVVRADAEHPAYRAVAECAREVGGSVRRAGARLGVAVPASVCTDVSPGGVEGQRWEDLALAADRISPEVYPSALRGSAGQPVSAQPYAAVSAAVALCYTRNLRVIRNRAGKPVRVARIEPWIQAYSTRGWSVGPIALGEELRALREHGVGNALLWNGVSDYDRFVPALRRGMAGRVVAYNPTAAEWARANQAPQGIGD